MNLIYSNYEKGTLINYPWKISTLTPVDPATDEVYIDSKVGINRSAGPLSYALTIDPVLSGGENLYIRMVDGLSFYEDAGSFKIKNELGDDIIQINLNTQTVSIKDQFIQGRVVSGENLLINYANELEFLEESASRYTFRNSTTGEEILTMNITADRVEFKEFLLKNENEYNITFSRFETLDVSVVFSFGAQTSEVPIRLMRVNNMIWLQVPELNFALAGTSTITTGTITALTSASFGPTQQADTIVAANLGGGTDTTLRARLNFAGTFTITEVAGGAITTTGASKVFPFFFIYRAVGT